jgi:hypothetical protein
MGTAVVSFTFASLVSGAASPPAAGTVVGTGSTSCVVGTINDANTGVSAAGSAAGTDVRSAAGTVEVGGNSTLSVFSVALAGTWYVTTMVVGSGMTT